MPPHDSEESEIYQEPATGHEHHTSYQAPAAKCTAQPLTQPRHGELLPILPGKLFFTIHPDDDFTIREIQQRKELFFFSSDMQERYEPFCLDFGPVNLSVVLRFCDEFHSKMMEPRLANRDLIFFCSPEPEFVTNAVFLIGCYLMLEFDFHPKDALAPFARLGKDFILDFRDASYTAPHFTVSVLDCLKAIRLAYAQGLLVPEQFDLDEYEHWSSPLNGDMHALCPKFVAFKGPCSKQHLLQNDKPLLPFSFSPSAYIDEFKRRGVSAVVRLNEPEYDNDEFEKHGIKMYNLFFHDCTVPSLLIVEKFLDVCDKEKGVIAVHCQAGLGRTGTLIGVWMMRTFGWSAKQTICWLRLCRPGSVIGKQQNFLAFCEKCEWEGNRMKPGAKMMEFISGKAVQTQWNGCKSPTNPISVQQIAKDFAECGQRRACKMAET